MHMLFINELQNNIKTLEKCIMQKVCYGFLQNVTDNKSDFFGILPSIYYTVHENSQYACGHST